MDELERIKKKIKDKRRTVYKNPKKKNNKFLFKLVSNILVTGVLTLVTLIVLKNNTKLKKEFYKQVYETNFSFTEVNSLYKKYFGSSIPFKDFFSIAKPVFSEKLKYKDSAKYMDGVKLTVNDKYLVPNQLSGLVVFIGEKEGYGKTVVIQQVNGIDLWYGNIETENVKLYDYIEEGTLIGTTKDTNLYLVYKKDGKILDYQDYI